jgi:hypothetical protein
MGKDIMITSPEGIHFFHFAAQLSAIKLEGMGIRMKGGRSVLAHCKRVYGLKGNRAKVIADMEIIKAKMIEALKPEPEIG